MSGGPSLPDDTPPKGRPKRKSFLFDVIRVSMGAFAHIGLTMLINVIMIRVWGREVKGELVVIMNIPTIVCLFSEFGLKKIIPYMIGQQIEPTQRVIGIALSLWLASSVLGVSTALIYFGLVGVPGVPFFWCLLASALIMPRLLVNLLRGIALGVEELGYFNQLRYVRDLTVLMVVLGAMFVLNLGAEYAWTYILGMLISAIVVIAWAIPMLRRHAKIRLAWSNRIARDIVVQGVVFSLGSMLMMLNYRVDILILGVFLNAPNPPITKEAISDYSVGVAFANILWQMPIVIGHVLFSRSVNTKDPIGMARKTARLIRIGTALAIPGAVALFIFAPWLFPLIYGEEVTLAAAPMRILLPGIVLFYAARLIESDLTAKGRPWAVVSVMLPVVAANVVLNIVFIPMWGVNGAAFTSTLTYTGGAIGMVVIYSRVTGLSMREILTPRKADFALKIGRKGAGRGKGHDNIDASAEND